MMTASAVRFTPPRFLFGRHRNASWGKYRRSSVPTAVPFPKVGCCATLLAAAVRWIVHGTQGKTMRHRLVLFVLISLCMTLGLIPSTTAGQEATPAACPATTEEENVAIAEAWHEEVINQRNPAVLEEILDPHAVHHAAGGYPAEMNPAGVTAMMDDFLAAFPDLHYTFDLWIVQDDYVVERYTATGTQEGALGELPPSGRTATWTGINIFRIECGKIVEIWSEVDALSRLEQLTGDLPATPAP
jgi:predicted ester cyclase